MQCNNFIVDKMYFRKLLMFKIKPFCKTMLFSCIFQPCLITAHKNHNKHEIGKLEKPKILYPTLKISFLPRSWDIYYLAIKRAGNGSVIDRNERSHNLSDLLKIKSHYSVSFIQHAVINRVARWLHLF